MSIYVSDTSAAKAVSAYVILKGAREIATVRVHHGQSRCFVNVFQSAEAAKRSCKARGVDYETAKAKDALCFQYNGASGYGYDKLTSALSGLIIDGHELTDHCSRSKAPKVPKGRKTFPQGFKVPKGYSLANWQDGSKTWTPNGERRWPDMPEAEQGYSDCYRLDGLNYLKAIGYNVIQAI